MSFDKSRSVGNSEPAATPQVERKLSGGVSGLRVGSSGATCYGCATACVEHCLTLLRALATKQITRSAIMDAFTLPCLNILQDVMKSGSAPPAAPRKKKTRKNQTALTVNKLNLCLFVRQLMFGHG